MCASHGGNMRDPRQMLMMRNRAGMAQKNGMVSQVSPFSRSPMNFQSFQTRPEKVGGPPAKPLPPITPVQRPPQQPPSRPIPQPIPTPTPTPTPPPRANPQTPPPPPNPAGRDPGAIQPVPPPQQPPSTGFGPAPPPGYVAPPPGPFAGILNPMTASFIGLGGVRPEGANAFDSNTGKWLTGFNWGQ